MVRAKFTVQSITRQNSQKWDGSKTIPFELVTVKLSPVCDGTPENKKFWDATPSGTLELGMVNAEVVKQFELGKEYYVDFTPSQAAS